MEEKREGLHIPVNTVGVLEESETDTVDGRIAPALIEETTGSVEMVEVVLVCLAPPESHVANFEVAPEMACRVAVRLGVVVRAADAISEPGHGIVLVDGIGVRSDELEGLGPKSFDGLGVIVEVDREAVGLVVVLHESEHIVIDIAEEVDVGLDAPIVLDVLERGVLVEHAAVPPAHLVVRSHLRILDTAIFEEFGRGILEVRVDPRWHFPVFLGDNLYIERAMVSQTEAQMTFLIPSMHHHVPYLHSAFVAAEVLALNSSEKATSLKKVQG